MMRITAIITSIAAALFAIVAATGWWPGLLGGYVLPIWLRAPSLYGLPVAAVAGVLSGGIFLWKRRQLAAAIPLLISICALAEFLYFMLVAG